MTCGQPNALWGVTRLTSFQSQLFVSCLPGRRRISESTTRITRLPVKGTSNDHAHGRPSVAPPPRTNESYPALRGIPRFPRSDSRKTRCLPSTEFSRVHSFRNIFGVFSHRTSCPASFLYGIHPSNRFQCIPTGTEQPLRFR